MRANVILNLLLVIAGTTLVLGNEKGFRAPPAAHAKTYNLTETHDDEQVSIALDLYSSADKAAIFKVKYNEMGFLPIRLIISNDGGKPLMLDNLKIEYVTARRDKLQPATKDDLFRRIARPEKAGARSPIRLPIPGPKKPPAAVSRDAMEEVDSAMFVTVPVMPQSTSSGFLFFDVAGIENPQAGAHVYISGIKAATKELFYFDIPLQK
jgi:hypothetical protein